MLYKKYNLFFNKILKKKKKKKIIYIYIYIYINLIFNKIYNI